MENQYNYYSTFVFYDRKGRRLSIFAEETSNDTLLISVIPCSLKDQFNKRIGRQVFETSRGMAEGIIEIPVEDEKPMSTFLKYCRDNFYKVVTGAITLPMEVLIKVSDFSQIGLKDLE